MLVIGKKRNSKYWFDNEKKVMKKLGLEPVPGSGSGQIHKEDGENDFILCQLKSTEQTSYKINRLDVEKLLYNSEIVNKIPLFAIQFMNGPILLATVPEEIGHLAEYLNKGLFDRKQVEVYDIPKQSKVKKAVKGSGLTKDEVLEAAVEVDEPEQEEEDFVTRMLKRKQQNKQKRG